MKRVLLLLAFLVVAVLVVSNPGPVADASPVMANSAGGYRCYFDLDILCRNCRLEDGCLVADVGDTVNLYANHDYLLLCQPATMAEARASLVRSGRYSSDMALEIYCKPSNLTANVLPAGTQFSVTAGRYLGP